MNCKQGPILDSSTEGSLTENDVEREESNSEIDSLSKESEFLQSNSNADTDGSHLKCMFNTNTTNSKNEGSEVNLKPVVWQKFQFLISVLKDIQLNIQEMDSLIIDQHKKDAYNSNCASKNSCADASVNNLSVDPLVNVADSSKTDEAKLNEILCLLHRITDTLSAFEENPLLRDDLGRRGDLQETEIKEQGDDNSSAFTSVRSSIRRSCDDFKKIFGDDVEDIANARTRTEKDKFCGGGKILAQEIPFEGCWSSQGKGRAGDEEVKQKPSPRQHRFTKETRSLRSEIEAVVRRKELLDEKLKRLIIERQQQRLQEEEEEEKSASREEMTVNFSISQLSDSSENRENKVYAASQDLAVNVQEEKNLNRKSEVIADYTVGETARNEAFITELRNEENEIPGLAGEGLSSEINSLNITIREILKENYELHTLCNEFSDRVKLKRRKGKQSQADANLVETRFTKPRENKHKENYSRKNSLEDRVTQANLSFSDDPVSQSYDEERRNQSPLMRNGFLSDPYLKASFDKKIRELLKEQTDLIKQLQTDKRAYDEKCYNLERMVTELTRANRETRSRLVEELHVVDVENCRLEDEVHTLQRENWRLTKGRIQRNASLKEEPDSGSAVSSAPNREEDHDNVSNSCRTPDVNKSPSTHEVCLEHIQRLLKEKEIIIKNSDNRKTKKKRQCTERSQSLRGEFNHQIFASHNDLSSTALATSSIHKCSSLPVVINQNDIDDCDNPKPMTEEELSNVSNTTEAASLNSEVTILKNRMDYVEAYLNRQIHHEKPNQSSKKSENDVSSLRQRVDNLTTERDAASKRMEELMGIARDLSFHFRVTREELASAKREKHFLMEKLKTRSEEQQIIENLNNGEASSQYLSLITKLQERCHDLQLEVERAREEAYANALEKQRLTLDNEKLNRFLTSSLAHIEEENARLQASLRRLEEENKERRREASITKSGSSNEKNNAEETSTGSEIVKEESEKVAAKNQVTVVAQVHHEWEEDGEKEGPVVAQVHHKGEEDGEKEGPVVAQVHHEAEEDGEKEGPNSKSKEEEVNANWQRSLLFLQRCFVEEKLHSQLLEAAERENSARLAVLQEAVKEKGEKYQELLTKYKKLHSMLLASKFEKKVNKKILKECTVKIEEFNSTTTAIEDNYKVMLSSLGNNIGIAVEILSSHLYFSPSQVHPSPDLSADPAFWFAAQCSRLRWLQSHLRKLCLRSWKGHSFDNFFLGESFHPKKAKKSKKDRRFSTTKDASFRSGHSLDLDAATPSPVCRVLRSSHSTPSSPNGKSADVFEKEQKKEEEEKIEELAEEPEDKRGAVRENYLVEDDLSSNPSLHSSILLSSMNDAEINLTNEQAKLVQHKRSQFDALVGILRQNASIMEGRSSVATFLPSPQIFSSPAPANKIPASEAESSHNSYSEGFHN